MRMRKIIAIIGYWSIAQICNKATKHKSTTKSNNKIKTKYDIENKYNQFMFSPKLPLHHHSFLAIAMSDYLNTIPQASADYSLSHNSRLIAAFVYVGVK